jgi:hypothetical protein
MNNTDTLPSTDRRAPAAARNSHPRYLYAIFALVLTALVVWGFQHFYLHGRAYPGRPLTPPIRTLVILHGVAMAGWMLLFVAQPFLISTGNRRLHMNLGKVGAVIALAIVVLGMKLGIDAARVNPSDNKISGLVTKQFLAVPIISILAFGACVAGAIWFRRRAELHRALILVATLTALGAATARIDLLNNIYANTAWERVFGPFLWPVVIALLFLAVKSLLTRKLDVSYALGCCGLIVLSAFIMWIAPTPAWDSVASFLLR